MLPSLCHIHDQKLLPGMRTITMLAISSSQKLLYPSAISRNAAPRKTIATTIRAGLRPFACPLATVASDCVKLAACGLGIMLRI